MYKMLTLGVSLVGMKHLLSNIFLIFVPENSTKRARKFESEYLKKDESVDL